MTDKHATIWLVIGLLIGLPAVALEIFWLAYPVLFALSVLASLLLLGKIGDPPSYWIRFKEHTDWGDLFDIVSPTGETVGFDRYVVAKQRCAGLNETL